MTDSPKVPYRFDDEPLLSSEIAAKIMDHGFVPRPEHSAILTLIDTQVYWGLGRMGCHDIYSPPRPEPQVRPGEESYEVKLDTETGNITITGFDGQGNEIGSRQM